MITANQIKSLIYLIDICVQIILHRLYAVYHGFTVSSPQVISLAHYFRKLNFNDRLNNTELLQLLPTEKNIRSNLY